MLGQTAQYPPMPAAPLPQANANGPLGMLQQITSERMALMDPEQSPLAAARQGALGQTQSAMRTAGRYNPEDAFYAIGQGASEVPWNPTYAIANGMKRMNEMRALLKEQDYERAVAPAALGYSDATSRENEFLQGTTGAAGAMGLLRSGMVTDRVAMQQFTQAYNTAFRTLAGQHDPMAQEHALQMAESTTGIARGQAFANGFGYDPASGAGSLLKGENPPASTGAADGAAQLTQAHADLREATQHGYQAGIDDAKRRIAALQAQPADAPGQSFGTPTKLIDNLEKIESADDPDPTHQVNKFSKAVGPLQFTPETIAMLRKDGYKFDPFDRDQARQAADYYFQKYLLPQNGGDYSKALAAWGGFNKHDPTKFVGQALAGVDTSGAPVGASAQPAGTPQGAPGAQPAGGTVVLDPRWAAGWEATTEEAKQAQEMRTKYETELNDEAQSGANSRLILQNIAQNLKNFEPGKMAELKKEMIMWSQALGMPVSPDSINAAASMQDVEKLTTQLATESSKQVSSRPTQMEFLKFAEANPNIMLTPEGLQRVMEFMDKRSSLNLEKQRDYEWWKGMVPNSVSPTEFDTYWNQRIGQMTSGGRILLTRQNVEDTMRAHPRWTFAQTVDKISGIGGGSVQPVR